MGSASPNLKPVAASACATTCAAAPTQTPKTVERPENTNEQRRSERRSDQSDMASREQHNSGGGGGNGGGNGGNGGNGGGGHGFDFPSSGFGSGGRGHHQGQRGFMKPQGRDYTKPRSFTSSPTQNRGAVRVRPGRELYRAPGVWDEAPQLNPSAQEFSPLSPAPLTSSRSMDWGPGFKDQHDNITISRL